MITTWWHSETIWTPNQIQFEETQILEAEEKPKALLKLSPNA